jgi:uncharacterized heparinase superfamily protein
MNIARQLPPPDSLGPEALTAALARMRARAWEPIAFKLSFTGPLPDRLRAFPKNLRGGNLEQGEEIHKGRFAFAGAVLEAQAGSPWTAHMPSSVRFREELESFSWLRHLGAVDRLVPEGVAEVREAARALTENWIDSHGAFAPAAWSPPIVGRRIFSWLTEARLLSDGADLLWRTKFHQSLAQQARYLSSVMEMAPRGLPRLTAVLGVVLGCLSLGDGGPRRARAIHLLIDELNHQILADGGHASRSPALQLEILADLLTLKEGFRQSNTPSVRAIEEAIARMMPMLQFFHVGAGRLAAFHGAGGEAPETVLAVLGPQPAPSRKPSHAPQSGFDCMSAGETLVLVDSGPTPPLQFAQTAHAGAFAFELASKGQPIVVNCGRSAADDAQARVFRTPAAHSTLSFVGAPARTATPREKTLTARLAGGPREVEITRGEAPGAERPIKYLAAPPPGEDSGGTWLELAHNGYGEELGRRHVRRFYLDGQGADLRGEDRIEPILDGPLVPAVSYRLRFHLHPGVAAELEEGRVRLALPGGEVWQFRHRGGELVLAESIFNGPDGARATKQIVIKGEAALETISISWAFRRD